MARRKVFHCETLDKEEFFNKGSSYVRNVGTMPGTPQLRLTRLEGRFDEVCKDGEHRFCCAQRCKDCKVQKSYDSCKKSLELQIPSSTVVINFTNCTFNGRVWDLISGEEVL